MRTDRIFCSKEELLLDFHKRRAAHVKVIKVIGLICEHCGSSFVLYCGKLYRKTSYMSIVFWKFIGYYPKNSFSHRFNFPYMMLRKLFILFIIQLNILRRNIFTNNKLCDII